MAKKLPVRGKGGPTNPGCRYLWIHPALVPVRSSRRVGVKELSPSVTPRACIGSLVNSRVMWPERGMNDFGARVGRGSVIGIVIVANGRLAVELRSCLEQIIGMQEAIETVEVQVNHDRASKQQEICDAACRADQGQGVVIVTDLYGSTPANLSFCACHGLNSIILCGVNMPMLIKLAVSRRSGLHHAAQCAIEAGRQHVRMFDDV